MTLRQPVASSNAAGPSLLDILVGDLLNEVKKFFLFLSKHLKEGGRPAVEGTESSGLG